ncbi:MAG TPA: hypothetical protein VIY09_00025 [Rhizomicrobium sp.]
MSDSGATPLVPPAKSSTAYRGALAAVIVLGVLIAIALGILVTGLVIRFSHGGHDAAAAPAQFTLAPGTRLVSMDFAADRLVVRLRGPAGDEVDIIDTQTGRLIAKIRSAAPPRK